MMKVEGSTGRTQPAEGWKKEIARLLRSLDLVGDQYTGRIVLNFNLGTLVDLERTERLK